MLRRNLLDPVAPYVRPPAIAWSSAPGRDAMRAGTTQMSRSLSELQPVRSACACRSCRRDARWQRRCSARSISVRRISSSSDDPRSPHDWPSRPFAPSWRDGRCARDLPRALLSGHPSDVWTRRMRPGDVSLAAIPPIGSATHRSTTQINGSLPLKALLPCIEAQTNESLPQRIMPDFPGGRNPRWPACSASCAALSPMWDQAGRKPVSESSQVSLPQVFHLFS